MSDAVEERQAGEPPELNIAEVRDLVAEGREQGYLSAEHVHDLLQDVELTAEQIDDIFLLFTTSASRSSRATSRMRRPRGRGGR